MEKIVMDTKLEGILKAATMGDGLENADIRFLLGLKKKEHLNALFSAARHLRRQFSGNKIFLYGFLYISTYCRNNCNFCYYRRSNGESVRYRKNKAEIVSAARELAQSGVHLIDLTMGEDPELLKRKGEGYDWIVDVVESVKAATGLPVMISPGLVSEDILVRLADAGVTWYACYQETHSRKLFERLRPGQNYDDRLTVKVVAHAQGILIEEGLLGGVGESSDDIADSIDTMRCLEADQIRIMNFVPQSGTPMADWSAADPFRELVVTAVMRLVFPDRLIPASLDVDGLAGLRKRLDAGANVITSLVPPGQGLAGVAQSSLDIEDGNRTAGSVMRILGERGLCAASVEAYLAWINNRRQALGTVDSSRRSAC
ncbi:MAG: methylornithine synthase PylB [Deltaproteobacteria bacterium]|nr:methylornithine synthase PylB [Deltaproteobacteria bacterium]